MRSSPRNRARAGLSLALANLHKLERAAREHASALATIKRDLSEARTTVRLATEDARKAGVL